MHLIPAGLLALATHLALVIARPMPDSNSPQLGDGAPWSNGMLDITPLEPVEIPSPGADPVSTTESTTATTTTPAGYGLHSSSGTAGDYGKHDTYETHPAMNRDGDIPPWSLSSGSTTPTPTTTTPADFGSYGNYGHYGSYGSYGSYDENIAQ